MLCIEQIWQMITLLSLPATVAAWITHLPSSTEDLGLSPRTNRYIVACSLSLNSIQVAD